LPVSWTILNQGTGTASASTTVLRINQSSTNAGPVNNLASVSTPSLAPSGSVTESATLTAPTTPGVYDLWVIADNNNSANQGTNTGNDLQHVAFTVTSSATADAVAANTASNTPLSQVGPTTGTIDAADLSGGPDKDWFKITLNPNTKYTFTATATS